MKLKGGEVWRLHNYIGETRYNLAPTELQIFQEQAFVHSSYTGFLIFPTLQEVDRVIKREPSLEKWVTSESIKIIKLDESITRDYLDHFKSNSDVWYTLRRRGGIAGNPFIKFTLRQHLNAARVVELM